MPSSIGRQALVRIAELDTADRYVLFHGSEPLTNLPLILELIEQSERNHLAINYSLQTNGTLLNHDTAKRLIDSGVHIGISLDGLPRHHDKMRPYGNGNGSYSDVMSAIHLVSRLQGHVGVITVVTKLNANDLLEIAEHFEHEGIAAVSFTPVSHNDPDMRPSAAVYARELKRVLERYVASLRTAVPTIQVENLRRYLLSLSPRQAPSNCVRCTLGNRYPVIGIDIDGAIYPCDYFWGDARFRMGNICDDRINKMINCRRDFRHSRDVAAMPHCSTCTLRRLCGGGCPRVPYMEQDIVTVRSSDCEAEKQIFEYVIGKIPVLHQHGLVQAIIRGTSRSSVSPGQSGM